MSQPTVIYLHTEPWVSASPSVSFVTHTCLGLARAGAVVHMVVPAAQPDEPAAVLENYFQESCPADLTIHALRVPGRRAYRRAAAQCIRDNASADTVVITRSLMLLPAVVRAARACGAQVFFESHDCYFAPWQRADAALRRCWKATLRERRWLPQCDGLICLRAAQAAVYRQHLGDTFRICIAPTGIQPVAHQPRTWDASAPCLAYLGSLDVYKGLQHAVQLAAVWPQAQFLIIGGKSAAEHTALRTAFAEVGAADRLQITGWVDKPTMHQHLQRAHFGLSLITDTYFNRYLTSPVKMHDYLGVGLPVLTSDLPTTREIINDGDTGFVVDWSQPQVIAARLQQLTDHSYQAMCAQADAAAQSYTWTKRGEVLLSSLAGSRPSS